MTQRIGLKTLNSWYYAEKAGNVWVISAGPQLFKISFLVRSEISDEYKTTNKLFEFLKKFADSPTQEKNNFGRGRIVVPAIQITSPKDFIGYRIFCVDVPVESMAAFRGLSNSNLLFAPTEIVEVIEFK